MTDEPLAWRCFHCDFITADRAEAELHFGSAPIYDPMCRMTDAGQRREYITLDAAYSKVCEELKSLKAAGVGELVKVANAMLLADTMERAAIMYGPLSNDYLIQELGRRDLLLRQFSERLSTLSITKESIT